MTVGLLPFRDSLRTVFEAFRDGGRSSCGPLVVHKSELALLALKGLETEEDERVLTEFLGDVGYEAFAHFRVKGTKGETLQALRSKLSTQRKDLNDRAIQARECEIRLQETLISSLADDLSKARNTYTEFTRG